MARSKTYATRSVPGGGTEKIGVLSFVDQNGDTIKGEQYASYAYPAVFNKVAATANTLSTTVATEYPPTTGVTINGAGSNTTVVFSGSFSFGSPVGLLILFTSGTNTGQVRPIISVASGTTYNLGGPVLPAATANADTYELMVDCSRLSNLIIKTELSTNTDTCTWRPVYFSWNEDATGTTSTPIRYLDLEKGIDNTADNVGVSQATYYHGIMRSVNCLGAMGARFKLTALSGGSVSLWVAGI